MSEDVATITTDTEHKRVTNEDLLGAIRDLQSDDTDPEPADIGWNPQPRQRQSNNKAIAALTATVAIVAYLLGKRR